MTHSFGFFFRNGTVSYRLVSVSKLFKEPVQELGAKSSETVTVSEVLNAVTVSEVEI